MDIELGARVVTADGAEVGQVHRVVVDLEQQAVTALVLLQGRLLPRDVLVPLDFVERAEAHQVTLRLRRDELGDLPDFASNAFFAPPPTWALPIVLPGGAVYIPISQRQRMGPSQEDLTPGMQVRATDGDLGPIDRVELNDLGHLAAVWVKPTGRHQALRIPVEWIEAIDERGVAVARTRQEIEAGPEPSGAA
jgi:sporulation protein YlmC with PRC-barrel domain